MTVHGRLNRSTRSRVELGMLMVALGGLIVGLTIALSGSAALAAGAQGNYDFAATHSDDTYKVLDRGVPFDCSPPPVDPSSKAVPPCSIKVRISLSEGAVRYLGLKSPVLAHGTAKGPATAEHLYFLKIPAAIGRRMKAKHVVALAVSVTGTAEYQVVSTTPGPGESSTSQVVDYTQTIDETGANRAVFGQGTRYGCFPIGQGPLAGGGDLVIGYVKYGQTCPKHP